MSEGQKPLIFVGSSRKDLREFPEDVQHVMGFALFNAQCGEKHPDAKPLRGTREFSGAGVLEIVEDWQGDTYRAVYTVRLKGAVYVLHAFQKKSKQGVRTPQTDIDLIKHRLRDAEAIHERLFGKEGKT
jgi:phage-related protein